MSTDSLIALVTAGIVFVCVLAGAGGGMLLRSTLPQHHLTDDSKNVVTMATGLMATMAALVLGLLIASAKSSFDTQYNRLKEIASDVILLDRVMAHYGPEAKVVRDEIRRGVVSRLDATWPEEKSRAVTVDSPEMALEAERLDDDIRKLSPQNEFQHELQQRSLQIDADAMQNRWLLFGPVSAIQRPFLVVLVFWVTVIFVVFGLFAPRNGTVIAVLFITAMSVSCAIFLILELDTPFDGMLKMSSAPLRFTLAHLGE